jgi:DNA-binding NtrC family response regulator
MVACLFHRLHGQIRSERVLVVEHDATRQVFLRHSLVQCGYNVLTVGSKAKADDMLQEVSGTLTALIVDAVLPGGGFNLAMAAHERGLLSLVIYADGSRNGGRRIKAYSPGGLIYRGLVFGIGPLLDDLREAQSRGCLLTIEKDSSV